MSRYTKAERFFYEHAGYSYDPRTETADEGRTRCSIELARAERWARDEGIRFEWRHDDIDSSEFRDDCDPYWLWLCIAWTEDRGDDLPGRAAASLGGIDLGPNGTTSDPYARVIEAVLAHELMSEEDAR